MTTPLPDLPLSAAHTPAAEPAAAGPTAPSLGTAAAGPFVPDLQALWDDIHGMHELPPSQPIAALGALLDLADIPPLRSEGRGE